MEDLDALNKVAPPVKLGEEHTADNAPALPLAGIARHSEATLARQGAAAVATWIGLFGAGLLVDSAPFRAVLSSPLAENTNVAATMSLYMGAFAACVLFYTPLNVAVLALLSGYVGGCTSAVMYGATAASTPPTDPEKIRRLSFLIEHPIVSMLRSFLLIVGVYAGLYVTSGDIFANTNPAQYAKYAASLSVLAFVVGYDPMKFQDLIELIPAAGRKSS
jgi:hypothetical protein